MALVIGKPDAKVNDAHIPDNTSSFKFVANYSKYRAGHYIVQWRVKALENFSVPNGLHFVVNVLYDAEEPDVTGTLDVILPADNLKALEQNQWYNLVLDEYLVIQPHIGHARIQALLCNNENIDRHEYFGFVVEHIEIRPMALIPEAQLDVCNIRVPRAAIPKFFIDTAKVRPTTKDSSFIPVAAPVTKLATSRNSRYIASLALSQISAHITVWDMSAVNMTTYPKNMNKVYKCATTVIEHVGVEDLSIGLALSANGDQVVVYQEPRVGDWKDGSKVERALFPFKLFSNPLVSQPSVVVNMDTAASSNVDEKSQVPVDERKPGRQRQSSQSTVRQATPSEAAELKEVHWEHEVLTTFIGFASFLPESMKGDWEKNDVNTALTSNAEAGDGDNKGYSREKNRTSANTAFVTCNGLYLDVFRITPEKKWKRIHTITLTDLLPTLSRRITCMMMMESISNNTFMWLEDGGRSCTIWNLLTGSNITHISSIEGARFKGATFRGHSKMAISPHESIVALASVDGSLATYFANTGMAIDDRKFPGYKIEHVGFHAQDDLLFVILRSSVTYELSARVLDTLQLKSEVAAFQVPIPTIGTTLLTFFNVKGFWNRGVVCEPDGSKINCYISYQPTTSKVVKNSETVIKADPEDVIYESSLNGNIQYKLMTGIHSELLPEGDGVSYWVLRVEVVEENLLMKTQRTIFSFVPEPWMRITTSDVVHPESLQSAFFVPCGTRFAVVGMQTLQIWNLPTSDNAKCSLQFIWSQPRDEQDLLSGGVAYKSPRVRDYYLDLMGASIYLDIETGNTTAEIRMSEKSRKKVIPLPGPRTIGARYAIGHCFRSIHLLAASYAFSHHESKKSGRDSPQWTFTFEEHAEAIVRFTREHINRMMSFGAYSPRKRGQNNNSGNNNNNAKNPKRPMPKQAQGSGPDGGPAALGAMQPVSGASKTIISEPAPGVVSDHLNFHDITERLLDDSSSSDDDQDGKGKGKKGKGAKTSGPSNIVRPDVVTILTLLLDQAYLQHTNHIFVEGLLNTPNGDWIPRDNKTLNPIKRVIEARNASLLEAFIDYCIRNAKKYHPAYLMPAVQCLNELSDRYPNILADMFRKASYVPVHNHGYVASHAVIANPQYGKWLKSKFMFWKHFSFKRSEQTPFWKSLTYKEYEKSNHINDYGRPVFSLRSQLPLRATSFMNILNIETSVRDKREEEFPSKPDGDEDKKKIQSPYSHKIYVSPFPKLSMYGPYRPFRPWVKDTVSHKSAFVDIAGQDFFDSPAMVATLEFKWHKFGFFYWLVRFVVVFTFFVLVLIITAQQIHTSSLKDDPENPGKPQKPGPTEIYNRYLMEWRPAFWVAIAFGAVLIVYEFRQFLDSKRKYISSPYNYMDLAAYVTPVVGLTLFLNAVPGTIYEGESVDVGPTQVGIMSFSILFLYLNIAGRYEPIAESLDKGSLSFQIMMVVFYFFTTILLLNILIALMNDGFNESKDQGQLAWLKQWSEVIAEVEIFLMTPSTRQNRNFFPDYIYYGANEQEAELYESKYSISNRSNLSIENRFLADTFFVEQSMTQLAQRAILRDVQALGRDIDRLKQTQDGFTQDMTKLTRIVGLFMNQYPAIAQNAAFTPNSEQLSPSENDPLASAESGTVGCSVPASPMTPSPPFPLPSAAGPSSAAPGAFADTSSTKTSRMAKRPLFPASMRSKVNPTVVNTESPTVSSPTTHFNTPQGSTTTSPSGNVQNQFPGGFAAPDDPETMGETSSSAPSSRPPRKDMERTDSRVLRSKRLPLKLAVIQTMDDAPKAHRQLQNNNASHPIYVVKPTHQRQAVAVDDDDDYSVSDDEDDEEKKIEPVHHAQRLPQRLQAELSLVPSTVEEQPEEDQEEQLEELDQVLPQRTLSEIVST
ncbi:hypothetical protein BGZ65_008231, partial [Modicella reniformis]